MRTKINKKHPLEKEVIGLLKDLLPLHSIYVISVNTEKRKQDVYLPPSNATTQKVVTYTLLIICHKFPSKGLAGFMDDICNKMQQRCKVYAIMYTLSKVKKRLDYGDNFLNQIINKTPCLYKENKVLIEFKNCRNFTHESVYLEIEEIWRNRMNRAEYLLSILDSIEHKEDTISRLSTMHYALEQICLGLLYVFWEFKPQHYSLPYMLHLCNHFTQLPQTIFPNETYGLHRIKYMLCNAHHIIRFKAQNEFSDRDADKAYNRCELFYEEAKSLGDKRMEYLKELHCETVES
ncbi:hypothetical protein [Confluentibacter sediminis]|uniref:hypothetical protein n=1 Tax=Confluentibacter sediminis TaxID=2219045 RepID=UPI000DAD8A75|nr:hypothetical protein [Confluentibacter sediminis]